MLYGTIVQDQKGVRLYTLGRGVLKNYRLHTCENVDSYEHPICLTFKLLLGTIH